MDYRRISLAALVGFLACAAARVPADDVSPGARFGHEMVYDEARQVTVLFGGFGSDGIPKGDTWIWDGETWQLAASDGPTPRKWPAAAYDSKRRVIILHGGREGAGRSGSSLDDTWVWDGNQWTEIQVDGPTARDHHRAVYDRARDRVVLFGGWNGQSLENDTWEWDGSRWERLSTDGPSPRAPFGLAVDEELGAVILAGGQDLDKTYSDMWTWDGSAWTRLETELPSRRGFHAFAYSSTSKEIVLFGGRDGDLLLNDLWTWQDFKWNQKSSNGPLRRGIFASAFDRENEELLIHGGGDLIHQKWQLDSRTWAWSAELGWRVVSGPR